MRSSTSRPASAPSCRSTGCSSRARRASRSSGSRRRSRATARLVVRDASLGGSLARLDLRARLAGSGASAELTGLFLADGARHLDTQPRVEHAAGGTTSLQDYRGIAAGRGRGVINSKVVVNEGAQKSVVPADQPQPAALARRGDRHQARARDLRRRRAVQSRRNDRPARSGRPLLPALARTRRARRPQRADARVCRGGVLANGPRAASRTPCTRSSMRGSTGCWRRPHERRDPSRWTACAARRHSTWRGCGATSRSSRAWSTASRSPISTTLRPASNRRR